MAQEQQEPNSSGPGLWVHLPAELVARVLAWGENSEQLDMDDATEIERFDGEGVEIAYKVEEAIKRTVGSAVHST